MANIGIWPSQLKFRSMNFRQETKTKSTQTASGRVIRATTSTTRWACTIQFPVRSVAEHKTLQGFIALAQGPLNDFEIQLTDVSTSASSLAGSVNAGPTGNYSAGSTAIEIQTNQSSANVLKSGDVVRFANHSKVYMVTSDINTNVSGIATLNIQPALIEAVVTSEAITCSDVYFKMALANDIQEYNYRTDGFVEYEMDLIEVFG